MAEFTKEVFIIPALDRFLFEMEINVLDAEEVAKFQEKVQEEETTFLTQKFKQDHPYKYFIASLWGWCTCIGVSLAIMLVGITFKYGLLSLVGMAGIVCSIFVTLILIERMEKNVQAREWSTSPFATFEEEYKGDVVAKIDPCLATHHPLHSRLLNVTVEHHACSNTRFLLVDDATDEEGEIYYVDFWDKPEVPEPNLVSAVEPTPHS